MVTFTNSRHYIFSALTLFFITIFVFITGHTYADEGRIQIYRENPHYWEYEGKPVLLLGASNDF